MHHTDLIPEKTKREFNFIEAVKDNNITAVKKFIEENRRVPGAVNVRAMEGLQNPALIIAAKNNFSEIFYALLSATGVNVDAPNLSGITALMVAAGFNDATEGNIAFVKALLKKGANVNAKDTDGSTPLIHAVDGGGPEIIKVLLKRPELEVDAKDNEGNSALVYAAKKEESTFLDLLLPRILDEEQRSLALVEAAKKNNFGNIFILLNSHPKANVNYHKGKELTALMYAARNGDSIIVKFLLKQPELKINQKNTLGETALMHAAFVGNIEAVKLFLKQKGLDIAAEDWRNRTALDYAKMNGHQQIVDILLPLMPTKTQVGSSQLLFSSTSTVEDKEPPRKKTKPNP